MRDNKYRAWDIENKEFIYFDISCLEILTADEIDKIGCSERDQYTGQKDKNEKEVYENDLINYEDRIYRITWGEDRCQFEYEKLNWCRNQYAWNFNCDVAVFCEKVGSCFENPELLKL